MLENKLNICYITISLLYAVKCMDIIYENKTRLIESSFANGLAPYAHLHKELEIIYVRKGKSVAYADKNSYMLNAGDMFITFPNQVHYYRTVQCGEYIVLIFSPDILYGISAEISKSIPDINCFSSSDDRELKDIFDRIYASDGEYKNTAISGYLNVIMSRILPRLRLQTVNAENNSAFYNIIDFFFISRNCRRRENHIIIVSNFNFVEFAICHSCKSTIFFALTSSTKNTNLTIFVFFQIVYINYNVFIEV